MASARLARVLLRGQAGGRRLGSSGDGDDLEDDMSVNMLTLDNVIPPHQPQPDQTRPKAEPEDGDAVRQTVTTVGIIVLMSMATLLVMYCLFARSGYGRWTKQRGSFKWVAAPVEPGEKPCLAVRVWLADGAPVALPPGVMQQLQDQMGDALPAPHRPRLEPIPSPPEVSPPMLPKIKSSNCPTPPDSPSKVCMGIGIPTPPESSPPMMPQMSRNHPVGIYEGAQAGARARPTSASSVGAVASACRGERRPASAGAVASGCRGRAVEGERRPASVSSGGAAASACRGREGERRPASASSGGAVASACRVRAVQGERRPASASSGSAVACRGRAVQGERRPSSASSCGAVPSPCRGRGIQSAPLREEPHQQMKRNRCQSAPHQRSVEQPPQDASLQPPLRRPGAWSPAAVEARAHASKLAILDDIALRRNSRPPQRSESLSQPTLRRNSQNLRRSASLS